MAGGCHGGPLCAGSLLPSIDAYCADWTLPSSSVISGRSMPDRRLSIPQTEKQENRLEPPCRTRSGGVYVLVSRQEFLGIKPASARSRRLRGKRHRFGSSLQSDSARHPKH